MKFQCCRMPFDTHTRSLFRISIFIFLNDRGALLQSRYFVLSVSYLASSRRNPYHDLFDLIFFFFAFLEIFNCGRSRCNEVEKYTSKSVFHNYNFYFLKFFEERASVVSGNIKFTHLADYARRQ